MLVSTNVLPSGEINLWETVLGVRDGVVFVWDVHPVPCR